MSTSNNFKCSEDFPTSDIVLGFLLSVGIFISFLPQILVLIFRKNVEGLSVISCWFNYANCMGTFLNILFLNWFIFECCGDSTLRWMVTISNINFESIYPLFNSWVCFENLLPVVQMGVPFVTTGVIFGLYVLYRPKLPPLSSIKNMNKDGENGGETDSPSTITDDNNTTTTTSTTLQNSSSVNTTNHDSSDFTTGGSNNGGSGSSTPILPKKKKAEIAPDSFLMQQGNNRIERLFIRMDWYSQPFFWGTNLATIVFFVIGVALVYGYGSKSTQLEGYAFFLGVLAAILVFFQWMPQIYTTWLADEIGSLSLVSLCIQVPGALLVCYFQLSSGQSWITWFPYLATAIQEGVLVVLCIYYLVRDKRRKRKQEKEEQEKKNQQGLGGVGDDSSSSSLPSKDLDHSTNQPSSQDQQQYQQQQPDKQVIDETTSINTTGSGRSIGINNTDNDNDNDQSGGHEYYQSTPGI
ncbi:hypothetical protein DFA_06294 [Cavenderia fasciculata]|uniref:PQ-loop repeat-containing protein n=1 Tax=Cavenderia fasciculata TaxID=261658 RepID=F4PKM4_CACFS|nr:uncharacterized protein DFA_06294 [Cavenderia fasciculata]EGG24148.1 hypothetical protein DFA_06294 [Cavenderia fasciculata]|eukprot:XP_004361999.1 hypothetical protein DFA_06294 [Cavenderia fasciculata]